MEHELKIIYKFHTDDGYLCGHNGNINTKVYLDDKPIGLIQSISFKHNAKHPLHQTPEIIIDFPSAESFDFFSLKAKQNTIEWLKTFKKMKVIKCNLLQVFDRYINLIAFW